MNETWKQLSIYWRKINKPIFKVKENGKIVKLQMVRFDKYKEDVTSVIKKLENHGFLELELGKDTRERIYVLIGNKKVATVVERQIEQLRELPPCKIKVENINRLTSTIRTNDGVRLKKFLDIEGFISKK